MAESRILIERKEETVFITVEGAGTIRQAIPLKKAYEEYLKNGVTDFIFDLGKCDLLDSTFLGVLLVLGLKVKEKKLGLSGQVRVLKANPLVLDLFRNIGLDRIVIFVPSETEAGT